MLKMILYILGWGGKLKNVLVFFRDTLSGTTYTVVSLVCFILICICIHYLKKKSLLEKKNEKEEISSRVVLVDPTGSNKRIEVALNNDNSSISNNNTNIPVVSATDVTNVLVDNNIYSDNISQNTNVVPEPVSPAIVSEEKGTKPVLINPMEVANVSSTLNVIGSTSEQKSDILKNSLSSVENVEMLTTNDSE